MDRENVYPLGIISKTRGSTGALILKLNNKISEKFYELGSVFLEIEGLLVPFFINSAESLDQKNILLNLDSVETKKQGEKLTGSKVYTELSDIVSDEKEDLQYNYLIGYNIFDEKFGDFGVINEILSYSTNTLFKVMSGEKEIIIPLHEDFILSIDSKKKIIKVNLPEGLPDLYE